MQTNSKGKAKASNSMADTTNERTSLLPVATSSRLEEEPITPPLRPRRPYLYAAVISISTLFAAFILLVILLLHSYIPPDAEREALASDAVVWRGPKSVQLVNVTDDGIWLEVEGWIGIDADVMIATKDNSSSKGAVWWEALRRGVAQKAIQYAPPLSVTLDSEILVFPKHFTSPPLISLHVPDPILIPLSTNIEDQPHTTEIGGKHVPAWLTPIKSLARVRLIASTGELLKFAQRAWETGDVEVLVGIRQVRVQPSSGVLRSLLKIVKEDLNLDIFMQVPALPHLPPPGSGPLDLAKLVTLRYYSLETSLSTSGYPSSDGMLLINALATIPNILPDNNATLPFGLPFAVFLPADDTADDTKVKMAEVMTEPIVINSYRNDIEILLHGRVVADLAKLAFLSPSSLSLFLQNYLRGEDNPIVVQGLSSVPKSISPVTEPPSWLLHSLPTLTLALAFPGPQPPPRIIRSVTIEKMRLTEQHGKMKASGVVVALIELPEGMRGVDVDVDAVRPDVLVFDGAALSEVDEDEEYPPRAFGHIHPAEYLDSTTERHPSQPHILIVRAPLYNVDLDILPGRDSVLSDFVGKVVFKGGALAGVNGSADVRLELGGVNGEVTVQDLPVRGEFWVGKQRDSWSVSSVVP